MFCLIAGIDGHQNLPFCCHGCPSKGAVKGCANGDKMSKLWLAGYHCRQSVCLPLPALCTHKWAGSPASSPVRRMLWTANRYDWWRHPGSNAFTRDHGHLTLPTHSSCWLPAHSNVGILVMNVTSLHGNNKNTWPLPASEGVWNIKRHGKLSLQDDRNPNP